MNYVPAVFWVHCGHYTKHLEDTVKAKTKQNKQKKATQWTNGNREKIWIDIVRIWSTLKNVYWNDLSRATPLPCVLYPVLVLLKRVHSKKHGLNVVTSFHFQKVHQLLLELYHRWTKTICLSFYCYYVLLIFMLPFSRQIYIWLTLGCSSGGKTSCSLRREVWYSFKAVYFPSLQQHFPLSVVF